MTHPTIAHLLELRANTPPGEWKADDSGGLYMNGTGGQLMGDGAVVNAELIVATHNAFPGLAQTIRNLRDMLLSTGINRNLIDRVIAESMKGEDPS